MLTRPLAAGLACVLVGPAAVGAEEADAAGRAYFETHIRPVLVAHCLDCHGADAEPPGGNLRLDLRAGWELGGDSGPALAPGEATPGVLMQALRYESSEMPPDGKLPAEVIAKFERWIADGAADPRGGTLDHPEEKAYAAGDPGGWAFTPPILEPVPDVADAAWPRTEADRFLLAKMEDAGLAPAPDAAPAAAFRRLHYDLAGLPPDPEDLAAFVADPTDARWAAAVDRLLASPRFGRVWGRHWLDVARYADSNGSDFNATWPDAWRYRDYVVDSFNADVPFDRFLIEQLAGDLLPADTDAGRTRQTVATGFLALGTKMLSERDKEKFDLDVADEQIDAVGRSMLGLTLGCARCHDHKFDPVPARDYYALAGIFTSTKLHEGEIIPYVSDFARVPLPEDPAAKAARGRHAAAVERLTRHAGRGEGGPGSRRPRPRRRRRAGRRRGGRDARGVVAQHLHQAVRRRRVPHRRRLGQGRKVPHVRRRAAGRRALGGPAVLLRGREPGDERAGDAARPGRRNDGRVNMRQPGEVAGRAIGSGPVRGGGGGRGGGGRRQCRDGRVRPRRRRRLRAGRGRWRA